MFAYLFICSLLVPLSMILLGNQYRKKPPLNRQGFSGYKTTMSRLNEDTWTYAHSFVGKLWIILGSILLLFTGCGMFYVKNNKSFEMLAAYMVFVQLGIMGLTIIPVEMRLHKVFDKNGRRK